MDDFKRVLARVQRDFGFYIGCRTEPEVALAGYDLSPAERRALAEPDTLAELLRGVALRPVTVKISGSHDWINRAIVADPEAAGVRATKVEGEVDAIRRAGTETERTGAVVRLLELIG